MISVINAGIGNFNSIHNMLKKLRMQSVLTNSYDEISKSQYIILPGVGSFDKFITSLNELKINLAIENAINDNKSKLLGICVGMQVLFKSSEEGVENGLGLIEGTVSRFSKNLEISIPHMGWNKVNQKKNNVLFSNKKYERFYFAHSYHCICADDNDVLTTTFYGNDFVSSVNKNNIYGFQFHPEKSHEYGKEILYNFVTKC